MGGPIAVVAATLLPGRVATWCWASPTWTPGAGASAGPIAQQSEAEFVARGHAALVRAATDPIWAGSVSVASPVAVHRGAVSLVRGGVPSWREQLAALTMPRAVIFGANARCPIPTRSACPGIGVGVLVVPGAGHSMAWENPAGLARAIRSVLS